ncbi:MAG: hypothetical protein KKG47_07225 [Proteobacteria bacterium]|nr:hypothetical protein [Pseudomonadota bacterium]
MAGKPIHLRSRVLIPVGLALFVISFIGFLATYYFQKQLLEKEIDDRLVNANKLFSELVVLQSELLINIAETLTHTEVFEPLFLGGHRDLLAKEAFPEFIKIRGRYQITHFYFHALDQTCFLRVHNPKRYGDTINRHTLKEAVSKDGIASGIELGPLGTITLRVVIPWRVNGTLIGYLELGKELEYITINMIKVLDLELMIAIEKQFLDRKMWEEGLTMLGRSGNWDQLDDYVIASSSMTEIPVEFSGNLEKHAERDHRLFTFDITHKNRTLKGGIIPLRDAGGNIVGDIFAFLDYSKIAAGNRMFALFASGCALVILAFFFLVSGYLQRVEKSLGRTLKDLSSETERNRQIALELARHRDNLDELVNQRTAELEQSQAEVKILSGFLPICAGCKSIKNKDGGWEQIESYIRDHSEAEFSHSYCPKCAKEIYSDFKKV